MKLHFLALAPLAFGQPAPLSPIPVPPRPSSILPGHSAPVVTDIWVIFKS